MIEKGRILSIFLPHVHKSLPNRNSNVSKFTSILAWNFRSVLNLNFNTSILKLKYEYIMQRISQNLKSKAEVIKRLRSEKRKTWTWTCLTLCPLLWFCWFCCPAVFILVRLRYSHTHQCFQFRHWSWKQIFIYRVNWMQSIHQDT